MACLKRHFYHTVHLILINQSSEKFQTIWIRCHNRTSDIQITSCQSSVYIRIIFIHHLINRLGAAAIFVCNNNSAIILDGADHLLCSSAQRTSCYKNTRFLRLHLSFFIFFLNLFYQCIHLSCDQASIKLEGTSIQDFKKIISRNWSRIMLHYSI